MIDPSPGSAARPPARAPAGTVLFEIATEVCSKVGGIYQVIRSKAESMAERWQSRYTLVGPWNPGAAGIEFEPSPPRGRLAWTADRLREQGVALHHGTWLIPGRPRTVLLEFDRSARRLDGIKFSLWEEAGIESPSGNPVYDEALLFGDAVLRLLREYARRTAGRADAHPARHVIAHFHEWIGGAAIPRLRREGIPVAIVFTTHATLLGRYIASGRDDFYDVLPSLDHAAEAARYNIPAEHAIERACAHGAHALTTVSAVTAEECRHLLGREPDVITPNALNIHRYNVGHDFQTFHAQFKERINRFVMGHFFPSYPMDLSRTLYMFSSGRFEPRNKGFDLCLEALARLNAQLRDFDIPVNVVFFLISQRPTRSLLPGVLEKRGLLGELRAVCDGIVSEVSAAMFQRAAAGDPLEMNALVSEYWALRYRRTQQALRSRGLPEIITHQLEDEHADPVLAYIRLLGLHNRQEDPVKVVYHPAFISTTNPLWGMEYDQFVRGCHLGVFPSAYEPWGYTPLECMALGVPAITSDLAGFGRHIMERYPDHDAWGVNVLHRRSRPYHDAAADLARWLLAFCRLDRRGRINLRNEVERRSWDFDWKRLVAAYHRTHDLALQRIAAD